MNFTFASPASTVLSCCFFSLQTVIIQLYLLTILVLSTGGYNWPFLGLKFNIFHCKLTDGFSSAVNNPKH